MTSKTCFTIAIAFIVLYIISSFGVVGGLPDWVHRVCTIGFVSMIFIGFRQKKKENKEGES
jgi:hypothetical protein